MIQKQAQDFLDRVSGRRLLRDSHKHKYWFVPNGKVDGGSHMCGNTHDIKTGKIISSTNVWRIEPMSQWSFMDPEAPSVSTPPSRPTTYDLNPPEQKCTCKKEYISPVSEHSADGCRCTYGQEELRRERARNRIEDERIRNWKDR